jgi:AcrR family transcriptional regulator
MARTKQTEEQVAAMQERILDAAHELLHEQGPAALSVRGIAERAGVSHMVLYTYFENHAALIVALRERQRARMEARHGEIMRRAKDGDVAEVVRRVLTSYAEFAKTRPRIYQFLWVLPDFAPGHLPGPQQRFEQNLRCLAQLIQLGIERETFATRDPVQAAATVFSIVNGPLILYHSGRIASAALRDRVTEEALGAAMRYLRGE